jgi:myosin heavy subunit
MSDCDDMAALPRVSEDAVVNNIVARYNRGLFYTNVASSIQVAVGARPAEGSVRRYRIGVQVNPRSDASAASDELLRKYVDGSATGLPPHVFSAARNAYSQAVDSAVRCIQTLRARRRARTPPN